MMDAYLAAEAVRALRALAGPPSRAKAAGFLLGHRRGGCLFVESAVPAPPGFRPTGAALARMDDLLGGKIVGFFAVGGGREAGRSFLQPYACGKLFLEVRPAGDGGIFFLGFGVAFDGAFRLEPLELRFEPEAERS